MSPIKIQVDGCMRSRPRSGELLRPGDVVFMPEIDGGVWGVVPPRDREAEIYRATHGESIIQIDIDGNPFTTTAICGPWVKAASC